MTNLEWVHIAHESGRRFVYGTNLTINDNDRLFFKPYSTNIETQGVTKLVIDLGKLDYRTHVKKICDYLNKRNNL